MAQKKNGIDLDELLKGPDYTKLLTVDNVPSFEAPPVWHGSSCTSLQVNVHMMHCGRKLTWLMLSAFKFQALAGAQMPSNSIQGELIFITMFLTWIILFMAQTIMDSDLVKIQELVGVDHDLFCRQWNY